MDNETEFVGILGELFGALGGGAFLDIFKNLGVAGFVSDDEKTAARFLHGFQCFVIRGDSRRT